jgi:hypothetical protein
MAMLTPTQRRAAIINNMQRRLQDVTAEVRN